MITSLFAALLVGHLIGDYLIQQHTWSTRKVEPGWAGRAWCTVHAVTYAATCWVVLAVAVAVDGLTVNQIAVAVAMAANAALHGFLDRRWPLVWIIRATGSGSWLDADPRALLIFDQVVHVITLYAIAVGITAAS